MSDPMTAKSPGQAKPAMLDGARLNVLVVVSRFNHDITYRMRDLCVKRLLDLGVRQSNVTVVEVPGSFELPVMVKRRLFASKIHVAIALGVVIRGDTDHYDFVARAASDGLQLAALECEKPVIFGVLTTETVEQATERILNASTYAENAVEMANVFRNVIA